MGKTFKHNQDHGDVNKAKFADRRKKKLRKIVSHNQNLEVKNEDKEKSGKN